jgi:hypothetical protein
VLYRRLREAGGFLLLTHLDPAVKESLIAAGWPVGPAPDPLCLRDSGQDCFVVYARDEADASRSDAAERPVANCPTHGEAAAVRERLRESGQSCVIRFVGQTGGGD